MVEPVPSKDKCVLLKDTMQWCRWGSNSWPYGLESSTLSSNAIYIWFQNKLNIFMNLQPLREDGSGFLRSSSSSSSSSSTRSMSSSPISIADNFHTWAVDSSTFGFSAVKRNSIILKTYFHLHSGQLPHLSCWFIHLWFLCCKKKQYNFKNIFISIVDNFHTWAVDSSTFGFSAVKRNSIILKTYSSP